MVKKLAGLLIVSAFIFTAAACKCEKSESRKDQKSSLNIEYLGGRKDSPGPFCEAVRVGDFLILSGQIGRDPATGKLAEGGIKGEAKQTMENIKATLEKYGSSLDKVVKCTVMLADIGEWQLFNEVYVTYFKKHKPARSAFGANGLAGGARVEVEAWAVID